MIIAKLRGGLGNQMFIYAFARHLAHINNTDLKLDLSYYTNYHRDYELNHFDIIENIATEDEIKLLKKLKPKHNEILSFIKYKLKNRPVKMLPDKSYILDDGVSFIPEYMKLPDNVFLEGLFQSEKFFKDIRMIIKKEFTLTEPLQGKNLQFSNHIKSVNSVSLHVRRGDYITNQWAMDNLGLCSLEYYQKAIEYIESNTEDPHFFLFSDEIEWVKKHLKINSSYTTVDGNNENTGYEDLRLMSLCNHHITANSSFSWWGAWLGHNHNKIVISPKNWFKLNIFDDKDLVPDNWIKF
ncbi:MAG: alpha-1,2-fucosyltransferase [bacterium]